MAHLELLLSLFTSRGKVNVGEHVSGGEQCPVREALAAGGEKIFLGFETFFFDQVAHGTCSLGCKGVWDCDLG